MSMFFSDEILDSIPKNKKLKTTDENDNDNHHETTSKTKTKITVKKTIHNSTQLTCPYQLLGTVNINTMEKAYQRAKTMGSLNNSIRSGGGNLVGFIGEIMLRNTLREHCSKVSIVDQYDFDILVNNCFKIEVKTKEIKIPVFKPNFDNTVCAFNCRQKGTYVFLRVLLNPKQMDNQTATVWFCGAWPCDTFKDRKTGAVYRKKGTVVDRWTVRASCFNREVRTCHSFNWLLDQIAQTTKYVEAAAKAAAEA